MDLKQQENISELILKKDLLIADFNTLLNSLITNPSTHKKGALLYYWLRDYKNFLKNEESFDCKYLPAYHRGSIVNINFGFNIGSELGGLHYAVVLADSNSINPNLVVLPLKSIKGIPCKPLHKTELNLGNDLYNRLVGKHAALKSFILNEINDVTKSMTVLVESAKKLPLAKDYNKAYEELNIQLENVLSRDKKKSEMLIKKANTFDAISEKLSKMKNGSIALINQIQTVSKMRIIDPKDPYDVLYDVKLSSANLNLIDDYLIKYYTNKH